MLSKEFFGTDLYHWICIFIAYSVLGWFVESTYMSICNRKLTNRGFGRGPFCPIYGVGAVVGYIILSPFKENYIWIYTIGAISATIFEYIVGILMLKFLGSIWWDYKNKPFNYKGIICLESTIAWGFYAVGIVYFLQNALHRLVDILHRDVGVFIIVAVLIGVTIDYSIQFMKIFNIDLNKSYEKVEKRIKELRSRWS